MRYNNVHGASGKRRGKNNEIRSETSQVFIESILGNFQCTRV